MASQILEFFDDIDFTVDQFSDMSWSTDFFTACLHHFRWSGLSGLQLGAGELKVISTIIIDGLPAQLEDPKGMIEAFIFVEACRPSMETTAMFAIPVVVEINQGDFLPAPIDGTFQGVVHFTNGIVVVIKVATKEPLFWKHVGQRMLGNNFFDKNVTLTFLDPAFHAAMSNEDILTENDVEIKFLGGSDTTNIVMLFSIGQSPDLAVIVKFYPRIQFNTARFLNDKLSAGKFESCAQILATCDYNDDFLQVLFESADLGRLHDDVVAEAARLSSEASTFYPFMHFFKFIHGDSDGGAPFWKSAIGLFDEADNDVANDAILDLAKKLGISVMQFHAALSSRNDDPGKAALQRSRMIAKIEDQLRIACTFLKDNDEISKLTGDFAGTWSWLSGLMDFTRVSNQVIPRETRFIESPRQYIHQDLHMGQFIFNDLTQEFIVLDLEGDPQIPWEERIDLYHVEKDMASLVRSLSYIKIAALKHVLVNTLNVNIDEDAPISFLYPLFFLMAHEQIPVAEILGLPMDHALHKIIRDTIETLNTWETRMRAAIMESYQEFHELDPQLFRFYTFQRILNEISYEIKFRPRNYFIPCVGLVEILLQDSG
jgi:hypothetical protein